MFVEKLSQGENTKTKTFNFTGLLCRTFPLLTKGALPPKSHYFRECFRTMTSSYTSSKYGAVASLCTENGQIGVMIRAQFYYLIKGYSHARN